MVFQTAAAQELPTGATSSPRANRLLESLPEEDRGRLSPHLRSARLRQRHVLLRQGQPIQEIIFPAHGVCSLMKTTEDGHTIEIVGIGADGAVGATVAIGYAESLADVVVQVPDEAALALPVEVFKVELQRRGALFGLMAEYSRAFTQELMQTVACNALHSAEARCCRWLLMNDHRLQKGTVGMTQEMLAMTLGVRRPTVTHIMTGLHRAGIVEHVRGAVTILDRQSLEARACECYRTLWPSSR